MTPTTTTLDTDTRLLVSIREAAKMLSLSESSVWVLLGKGQLPRVALGGATRVRIVDVQRLARDGVQLPMRPRGVTT